MTFPRTLLALGFVMLATPALAEEVKIDIKGFVYTPTEITVKAGTKVTWVNQDSDPHTVVDKKKSFQSAALNTNGNFSQTFDKPGTYNYFCSVHPTMVGTVKVEAK